MCRSSNNNQHWNIVWEILGEVGFGEEVGIQQLFEEIEKGQV